MIFFKKLSIIAVLFAAITPAAIIYTKEPSIALINQAIIYTTTALLGAVLTVEGTIDYNWSKIYTEDAIFSKELRYKSFKKVGLGIFGFILPIALVAFEVRSKELCNNQLKKNQPEA